jgi:prophage antirepressor-like protein
MRDGRPHFVAAEVGLALGYEDGSRLPDLIAAEWSEEFIAGTDFVKLSGSELVAVKAALNDSPKHGESKRGGARSMILLTRDGLNLALMKTRKAAGVRMRRWLASEVLPALQQGELVASSDPDALARAIRAEMARQLRTPEARLAELQRLATEAATVLSRGHAALVPGIASWAIEVAKGVAGYGGAGRELGYSSDRQFHTMRAMLKSLPGLARIVPKRERKSLAKQIGSGDALPLFALTFDVGAKRVSLKVEDRPGAVVDGEVSL